MNESVWETFDQLFGTVRQQSQRIAELEARVEALERRVHQLPDNVRVVVPFPAATCDESHPEWPFK